MGLGGEGGSRRGVVQVGAAGHGWRTGEDYKVNTAATDYVPDYGGPSTCQHGYLALEPWPEALTLHL